MTTTTPRSVWIGVAFGPMLLLILTLTAIDDPVLFALIAVVIAWATFAWATLAARRH